jgi:uncharacterized membrane protein YhaH (DUF805 family)
MTFGQSIKTCFSKYVTFSGRAQRSEFWWWVLFVFVADILLSWVDIAMFGTTQVGPGSIAGQTDTPVFSGLFGLAVFLPGLAVSVRRLHDLDKSGWWILIFLILIIGWIILIVWYATEGTRGPNRFGADPLGNDEGLGGGEGLTASSIPSVPRD